MAKDLIQRLTYSPIFNSTIFGVDVPIVFHFVRVDNMVVVTNEQKIQSMASGSANDVIITKAGSEVPASFRPKVRMFSNFTYFINGANVNTGSLTISTAGVITLGATPFVSVPFVFNAGNNFILYENTICYVAAD